MIALYLLVQMRSALTYPGDTNRPTEYPMLGLSEVLIKFHVIN